MEKVKNIEWLSVLFTAGVGAGTLLSTGPEGLLPGLLLALLCLPVLLRHKLLILNEKASVSLVLGTFLLLGFFCARMAAFPAAHLPGMLETVAGRAAQGLRAFIGAFPFRADATAPLLTALLTGDRSGLSPETVAVFRNSGASHLLALSGLHMGIIYLLFDRLTRVMGQSPAARRIRFGAILAAAGFFTLMTGAGPSVVRAFLFIGINESLRLMGRPRKASRVLCLALLVQLAMDPSVIRSLGFQLSYLAMAGIVLLYPVLEKWYPEGLRQDPLRWIWKTAALSISCQVFTAPLAWLRFHSFPRYFLLTNLMAIPLTTALMAVAVGTLVLGSLGLCPGFLISATDGLCRLLLWVLEIIAGL